MSTLNDIYNPPPAPIPLAPPPPEPLRLRRGDLSILAALVAAVLGASAWAATIAPELGVLALLGGSVVIAESWSTALGFLQRRPWMGEGGRWKIFAAALVPWLVGLSLAAGIMIGVFRLKDWWG